MNVRRSACSLRLFVMLLLLCVTFQASYAQHVELDDDALIVYFRAGKFEYDPAYMGNRERVDEFIKRINTLQDDMVDPMTSVDLLFSVSSSPEGRLSYNDYLSRQRAKTMETFLRQHLRHLDSTLYVDHSAEAWVLLEKKLEESDVEWKDDVLEIIRNNPITSEAPDGTLVETRKMALRAYQDGKPWRYMIRHWFPNLRQFTVRIIMVEYDWGGLETMTFEEPDFPFEELVVENTPIHVELLPVWYKELTLKTNGIGLGFGIPNIAAEYDVAPHWSVALPFYYSGGYDYFKPTVKFRGIVLQPEVRWYPRLCGMRNDGFYVGAHLGLGWYNFALDGDYRIQDCGGNRPSWGGGVGVGYSLQFRKAPSWGMEFALGAGVYDCKYDIFFNEENGPYFDRAIHETWFGIDNVAISVTYKLEPKKKGGKR